LFYKDFAMNIQQQTTEWLLRRGVAFGVASEETILALAEQLEETSQGEIEARSIMGVGMALQILDGGGVVEYAQKMWADQLAHVRGTSAEGKIKREHYPLLMWLDKIIAGDKPSP
jgi:hypothetical protein